MYALLLIISLCCTIMYAGGRYFSLTPRYTQIPLIIRHSIHDLDKHMQNPHEQLIETICRDVLPNMVRIFESKKMMSVLDQNQFVTLLEEKIERANKSLKTLPFEDQGRYRVMIDQAYAENIDRLRKGMAVPITAPGQNIPHEHTANRYV
jgi:hypothetical protein